MSWPSRRARSREAGSESQPYLEDATGWAWGRDAPELSEAGEQITLKPTRQTLPLEKRHGFWVYTGQAQPGAGTGETLVADEREARAAALLAGGTPESGEGVQISVLTLRHALLRTWVA